MNFEVAKCPRISRSGCCTMKWTPECIPKHCYKQVIERCPDRKVLMFGRTMHSGRENVRRSPHSVFHKDVLPKCGTSEMKYHPCTSRSVADKLFQACCEQYVPHGCREMCVYEDTQIAARQMLIKMLTSHSTQCDLRYLSSILYCASQNRDNRQCCVDLNLNDPQLQVGGRCLRMCDPSGSVLELITKEDATCLYNWNVIMYCHHSGIREM